MTCACFCATSPAQRTAHRRHPGQPHGSRSTPESVARAGYDGVTRKKVSKIPLAVDTLGHLLALHVTPATESRMPFPIEAIQVDGGSEFMAALEAACETCSLPSTVEALNLILDGFRHLCNRFRPHGALAGLTPAAYLAKRQAARTQPSHMS